MSSKTSDELGSLFTGPQCLIFTDADGKLALNSDTIQQVAGLSDRKLVVVAIVGAGRTGKSYLLNRLAGNNAGFALGSTTDSKTKGIWIWVKEHPKNADQYLVLLDTEGLGDPTKGNNTHDSWLFCLTILLSSVLVYNATRTITEDALGKLNFVGEMAKHIHTRPYYDNKENDEGSFYIPQFIYAIRDFTLDLQIGDKEVTADEYLDHMLTLKTETDETTKLYNQPRMFIRRYFKERKCFIFDRPVVRNQLSHLDGLADDDLTKEFIEDSDLFCKYIYNNGAVKTMTTGQTFNGKLWSITVQSYVDAIRDGAVHCIENDVITVRKNKNALAIKEGLEVYSKAMSSVSLPTIDEETLFRNHSNALSDAIKCFFDASIWDDEHEIFNILKGRIDREYQIIKMNNQQLSFSKCCEIIDELFERTVESKTAGNISYYYKPGGYDEYMADADCVANAFMEVKTLGVMASDVLNKYRMGLKEVGEGIMAADKRITEEHRKTECERQNAKSACERLKGAMHANKHAGQVAKQRQADLMSDMVQMYVEHNCEMKAMIKRHRQNVDRRLNNQEGQLEKEFAECTNRKSDRIKAQNIELERMAEDLARQSNEYARM